MTPFSCMGIGWRTGAGKLEQLKNAAARISAFTCPSTPWYIYICTYICGIGIRIGIGIVIGAVANPFFASLFWSAIKK